MNFTSEDYQKILTYIKASSKKDSQFNGAAEIDGSELVSIIQDGQNKTIQITQLVGKSGAVVYNAVQQLTEQQQRQARSNIGISQTQVNWEENDPTSIAYIRNKPVVPKLYNDLGEATDGSVTQQAVTLAFGQKQGIIEDIDTIRAGASLGSTAVQPNVLQSQLATKVDKVEGKKLSTEDYTTEEKNKLASLENYDDTELSTRIAAIEGKEDDWDSKQDAIDDLDTIREGAQLGSTAVQHNEFEAALETKVDTVDGKGLSTNDYTNEDKYKLGNIEQEAQKNVQADWNETNINSDSFIKHKPDVPSKFVLYNNITGTNTDGSPTQKAVKDALEEKQAVITDLETIRSGAALGGTALQEVPNDYRKSSDQDIIDNGIKDRVTAIEDKEDDWDAKADMDDIPNIVDNVISTSTTSALSANQGKQLNDRINNITARGRFLSFWDATTGMPLTNPSGFPYEYHTGDYFIVNKVSTTNYIPNGSTYEGIPSTTVYTGSLKPNDSIYYDGTQWSVFDTPTGSGTLLDVYQNDRSVVSDGVAYVITPTALSGLSEDSEHRTVTDTQKAAWTAKYNKPSNGIPKSDLTSEVQSSLNKADSSLQAYVQTDWEETDSTSPAYLRNKPTIPEGSVLYHELGSNEDGAIDQAVVTVELNKKVDKVNNKQLSTEDYTTEEKNKLSTLKNYDTEISGLDTRISDIEDKESTWDGKQDTISDLTTIRSNAANGQTAYTNLNGHTVNKDVPSDAKFTDTVYDDTAVTSAIDSLQSAANTMMGYLPSEVTSSNKLADKAFVNSTVGTNTAIFRGTYNIVDDLGLPRTATHEQVATVLATVIITVTNNDYCFVVIPDEVASSPSQYDRYKYNGTSWVYEYSLNNSSFTSVQWAAINSGLTSTDKTNLDDTLSTISNYGNIVTHSTSEFATAAQGEKADTALQSVPSTYRTSSAQDTIDAGKQDKSPRATSIPSGGMVADTMYTLGTISADPNVTIQAKSDDYDHEWMLSFSTGATAPAVTFPTSVKFPSTPSFEANKHYEVSIKWDVTDLVYYGLIQSWNRI